jgi:hypothetical protein
MFERKLRLVYNIVGELNKYVTYTKAKEMAEHFTVTELDRIYKSLIGRSI